MKKIMTKNQVRNHVSVGGKQIAQFIWIYNKSDLWAKLLTCTIVSCIIKLLCTMFGLIWLGGSREVKNVKSQTDGQKDDGQQVMRKAHLNLRFR